MSLIKDNVFGITAYVPGRPIEEVQRELGIKNIYKLASNENPLGPSPKALLAIKKGLATVNRYPDGACFYLKEAVSKQFKLSADNFIFGNGSDELIDIIIKTFLKNKEEVLSANITFLEYKIITEVNGGIFKSVPLSGFKFDLKAIKKNITPKTKIIFIANPNNPTGTYLSKAEVKEFLKNLPKKVIVVFDEAYFEFVENKDFFNSLRDQNLINKNNIITLRTFSKAYGLAGLRLGYAIAKPNLISFMNRVRQPFNVNSMAQVAGIAALEDKAFIKRTQELIFKGKRFFYQTFDKLKIKYAPSAANFILFDAKENGVNFTKKMLKKGVILRDMAQYGLDNFVRVTIGTEKENRTFLKELKRIIK